MAGFRKAGTRGWDMEAARPVRPSRRAATTGVIYRSEALPVQKVLKKSISTLALCKLFFKFGSPPKHTLLKISQDFPIVHVKMIYGSEVFI